MGSRFAAHVLEVPALDDGDAQSAHGLVDIAALAAEQLTLQRTQLLRRLYDATATSRELVRTVK